MSFVKSHTRCIEKPAAEASITLVESVRQELGVGVGRVTHELRTHTQKHERRHNKITSVVLSHA